MGIDESVIEIDLFELLGASKAARAKDIDFHQLVPNDIKPDQEHTVLHRVSGEPSQLIAVEHR